MDLWLHLQPHLQQMMGEDDYATWIAPLSVSAHTESTLTLTTDNVIVADWVRDHLLRDIETVARSHFGADFRCRTNRVAPPAMYSCAFAVLIGHTFPVSIVAPRPGSVDSADICDGGGIADRTMRSRIAANRSASPPPRPIGASRISSAG